MSVLLTKSAATACFQYVSTFWNLCHNDFDMSECTRERPTWAYQGTPNEEASLHLKSIAIGLMLYISLLFNNNNRIETYVMLKVCVFNRLTISPVVRFVIYTYQTNPQVCVRCLCHCIHQKHCKNVEDI